MKLHESNRGWIMNSYGELQDGLFAVVEQGHKVIDVHVCRFVKGEPADREFFIMTVYEWNVDGEHPDVCNFSDHENLDFKRYMEAEVAIYDTREEMLAHFMEFVSKHNHF